MRTFDPDEYEPDAEFDDKPQTVAAYREQLRRDYEGLPFEKVLPGTVVENDYGACYRLSETTRGSCAVATRSKPARACSAPSSWVA